ncbi:hypothetical protein ElyMa_004897700 [Elysia marginata]|uniref:Uncharacterized protein n=1 Tax=Elysia marginata TaxID=1093978 RepID=A0AAV4IUI0_9GAST|nr:hypothetical protein ElyMa_004897700 [Elysia marginata]
MVRGSYFLKGIAVNDENGVFNRFHAVLILISALSCILLLAPTNHVNAITGRATSRARRADRERANWDWKTGSCLTETNRTRGAGTGGHSVSGPSQADTTAPYCPQQVNMATGRVTSSTLFF